MKIFYIRITVLTIFFNVAYFIYAQDSVDLTALDNVSISATYENNSDQTKNIDKLIDEDINTSFYFANTSNEIILNIQDNYQITKYTLTSSSADSGLDPKSWELLGSTDGSAWVSLDKKLFQSFPGRTTTREISVSTLESFRFFKLKIIASNGAFACQLNEWRIYGILKPVPEVPDGVTLKAISAHQVSIFWRDNSDVETNFEIDRSSNGTDYTEIGTTDANETSFTDDNLAATSQYIYRVRANNNGTYSSYATSDYIFTPQATALTLLTKMKNFTITDKYNVSGNEGCEMGVDNNVNTKYLCFYNTTWMQLQFQKSFKIQQYAITSGNDASERDPMDWTLEASNDGSNWTTLNTQSNQYFINRQERKLFALDNNEAYSYYRLNITRINGGSITQFSEWQLFANIPETAEPNPDSPTGFSASSITDHLVRLNWTDNISNETAFLVESSINDGQDWEIADTIPANNSEWFVSNLSPETAYLFRLKSINTAGSSSPVTVSATTLPGGWPDTFNCAWDGEAVHGVKIYSNEDVAFYVDPADNMDTTITWYYGKYTKAWRTLKETYGILGDPKLYVFLSRQESGGLGRISCYRDEMIDYRNAIRMKIGWSWQDSTGFNFDGAVHEMGHIVETVASQIKGSPSFEQWQDSKWNEIFQYDIYLKAWPEHAKEWYNDMIDNVDDYPGSGTYWFRDWFYPIYSQYGGDKVINRFYQLSGEYFPQHNMEFTRRTNMGEFIHFFSGAAGVNLKPLAKEAFGWTNEWELQFRRAQIDFPFAYKESEEKITENGGRISALYESTDYLTTSDKLIDENSSTKYVGKKTSGSADNISFVYLSTKPASLTRYVLTSGDASSYFDPTAWIVSASTDSINWTVLDTQSAQSFTERKTAYSYSISENSEKFIYFKIEFTKTNGSVMYLSEIALWGKQDNAFPYAPKDLRIKATTTSSVLLDWLGDSQNSDSYILERSTDNTNFGTIAVIESGDIFHEDTNLEPNVYYYRVTAGKGDEITSYSNTVIAKLSTVSINDKQNEFKQPEILTNLEKYPDNMVQIFNLNGQLVYKKHHSGDEWRSLVSGNSGLNYGIYIYRVTTDKSKPPINGKVHIP